MGPGDLPPLGALPLMTCFLLFRRTRRSLSTCDGSEPAVVPCLRVRVRSVCVPHGHPQYTHLGLENTLSSENSLPLSPPSFPRNIKNKQHTGIQQLQVYSFLLGLILRDD